jgi:hypothetical protein
MVSSQNLEGALGSWDRQAIRNTVHNFYLVEKKALMCNKLQQLEKIDFPWFAKTFQRICKKWASNGRNVSTEGRYLYSNFT